MFSWTFIQSNSIALALTDYSTVAGTAVALLGVSQFAISAVAAPFVGIAGKTSALPMALVILTCSLFAATALRTLVRR